MTFGRESPQLLAERQAAPLPLATLTDTFGKAMKGRWLVSFPKARFPCEAAYRVTDTGVPDVSFLKPDEDMLHGWRDTEGKERIMSVGSWHRKMIWILRPHSPLVGDIAWRNSTKESQ